MFKVRQYHLKAQIKQRDARIKIKTKNLPKNAEIDDIGNPIESEEANEESEPMQLDSDDEFPGQTKTDIMNRELHN
jgi:hypothetical protein